MDYDDEDDSYTEVKQDKGGAAFSRPCRFGDTCNDLKNGRCTYLHTEEEKASTMRMQPRSHP